MQPSKQNGTKQKTASKLVSIDHCAAKKSENISNRNNEKLWFERTGAHRTLACVHGLPYDIYSEVHILSLLRYYSLYDLKRFVHLFGFGNCKLSAADGPAFYVVSNVFAQWIT